MNDGLQPWYSNRKNFDLRTPKSYTGMVNEEGLAAINTIYEAQVKMLFLPALLYCKYQEHLICSYDDSTWTEFFRAAMLFNMDEKFEIASGRHGGKRNFLLFLLCCNPALRRVRKAVCNYWANTDLNEWHTWPIYAEERLAVLRSQNTMHGGVY